MKFLIENRYLFEVLSYLIIIFSVPTAIFTYIKSNKIERAMREFGTFDLIDSKFIDFQLLCMEKPYLNIFDVEDTNPVVLTELQKKEEIIAYGILFSLFERAYVMYRSRSFDKYSGQWEGWIEVMEEYSKRDNFRNAWYMNGFGWDKDFQNFLSLTIENQKERSQAND